MTEPKSGRRGVELDAARLALKAMEEGHGEIVKQLVVATDNVASLKPVLEAQLKVTQQLLEATNQLLAAQHRQETLWGKLEHLATRFGGAGGGPANFGG